MSWATKLRAWKLRVKKDKAKRHKEVQVNRETWYQQRANERRSKRDRNRKRRKLARTQRQRGAK